MPSQFTRTPVQGRVLQKVLPKQARHIPIMGLLSFLTPSKKKSLDAGRETSAGILTIDLATFRVGETGLGSPPAEADFFAKALRQSSVCEDSSTGIELGTKDGLLDYAFLSIDNFDEPFLLNGTPLEIGKASTEANIKEAFGEPYWIDRSDGETILFYEYAGGTIELQFEFSDARTLGFVTLSRNGVLSTVEQRTMHGVDKPWPPE